MVYSISERDSDYGSDSNGISLCIWVVVCEIASDVHDGSAPAVETEDLVGQVDDFPTLGIGELHSASPRPRGDVFWTEFLVQFRLEGCELHFRVRRKVEKRGVVGCGREGVLWVISSVHRGIERRWTVYGYRIVSVCRVGRVGTSSSSLVGV